MNIIHKGPLWGESFMAVVPRGIIMHARPAPSDVHQLGWQVVKFLDKLQFVFNRMTYATAEGIVAIASLLAALRATDSQADMTALGFDKTSSGQAEAIGLLQIASDEWDDADSHWKEISNCVVLPLRRTVIADGASAVRFARDTASRLSLAPRRFLEWEEAIQAVERVVSEAVLNVVQHAYPPGTDSWVYTCFTITPASHVLASLGATAVLAPEEEEWLKEQQSLGNFVFEAAIGDYGQGVPRSLYLDATEKLEEFRKIIKGKGSGRNDFLDARFELHQCLCQYAFHHDSTRKKPSDFPTRAAALNWRGLHRCWQAVRSLNGCLVLASGQGRAGFAVCGGAVHRVRPQVRRKSDLPGTLVVLRLPLETSQRRRASSAAPTVSGKACRLSVLERAPKVDLLEASHGLRCILDLHPKGTPTFAVLCPFESFAADERTSAQFMTMIRACPKDCIIAVMFADVPEQILDELRATDDVAEGAEGVDVGMPLILALWRPDSTRLTWRIVGHIPLSSEGASIFRDLERKGHVSLKDASVRAQELAYDWASPFAGLLEYDSKEKELRAHWNEAFLPIEDLASLLNDSLETWFNEEIKNDRCPFHFKAPAGSAYRLPTGRLACRFISVWEMLRSNRLLSRALGQLFVALLKGKQHDMRNICVVADGPASYFVARVLLGHCVDEEPSILMPHQLSHANVAKDSQLVLFSDAVFRGETIQRQLVTLQKQGIHVSRVVACLDLQATEKRRADVGAVPMISLATLRFDPILVDDSGGTPAPTAIEIDQIRHVPISHKSEFQDLTDDADTARFLEHETGLFRSGFHLLGERVHTISLPTDRLVERHGAKLVAWILAALEARLSNLPRAHGTRDVVLFYKEEAHVAKIAGNVCEGLLSSKDTGRMAALGAVFVSPLTVASLERRQVFPHPEESLLANIRPANSLFAENMPEPGFIAVYMDDACVTGNSLRDFLIKACRPEKRVPSEIIAMVVVNRLSPGENRFFGVCRELAGAPMADQTQTSGILFRLTQVFRLQVKSTEKLAETDIHGLVRTMQSHEHNLPPRLRTYLQAVADKISRMFALHGGGLSHNANIQHPFYPQDTVHETQVTTRAVRIRHLLALNQQNEGVLTPLLQEIQAAEAAKDFTLLHILAIEPSLLKADPLVSASRAGVRQLCMEAIAADLPPHAKSDALAVLAMEPRELTRSLRAILVPLLKDTHLADQLLTCLLAQRDRDDHWFNAINAALDDKHLDIPKATFWSIRAILLAAQRIKAAGELTDFPSALHQIHTFVSRMGAHLPQYNSWHASYMALRGNRRTTAAPFDKTLADKIQAGLACLDSDIIPAMRALHFIAREKGYAAEAERLDNAIWTAEEQRVRIAHMMRGARTGDGTASLDVIREAWGKLCNATLKTEPLDQFLARESSVKKDRSVLVDVMPRFLCLPVKILDVYRDHNAANLRLDISDEAMFVAAAGREPVRFVFKTLVDNVTIHGDENGAVVRLEGTSIIIRNRIRSDRHRGTGRGLALAKTVASGEGFSVITKEKNNVFVARVSFPEAFTVLPALP